MAENYHREGFCHFAYGKLSGAKAYSHIYKLSDGLFIICSTPLNVNTAPHYFTIKDLQMKLENPHAT